MIAQDGQHFQYAVRERHPSVISRESSQDKLNRLNEQKWGLFRAVKQPVEE